MDGENYAYFLPDGSKLLSLYIGIDVLLNTGIWSPGIADADEAQEMFSSNSNGLSHHQQSPISSNNDRPHYYQPNPQPNPQPISRSHFNSDYPYAPYSSATQDFHHSVNAYQPLQNLQQRVVNHVVQPQPYPQHVNQTLFGGFNSLDSPALLSLMQNNSGLASEPKSSFHNHNSFQFQSYQNPIESSQHASVQNSDRSTLFFLYFSIFPFSFFHF
jgi:hypothetical protein